MLAMVLLAVGIFMIILRFSFEALSQQILETWISNMITKGAIGFPVYYFMATLCSELFCYYAVIKAVQLRREYDWDVFFLISVRPLPEQNMLKPLIDETEANRLREELLDTAIMDNHASRVDDVSFDYSQAPTSNRGFVRKQSLNQTWANKTQTSENSSTGSPGNGSFPLQSKLDKKTKMHASTPAVVPKQRVVDEGSFGFV
jgi:hypothetical protein